MANRDNLHPRDRPERQRESFEYIASGQTHRRPASSSSSLAANPFRQSHSPINRHGSPKRLQGREAEKRLTTALPHTMAKLRTSLAITELPSLRETLSSRSSTSTPASFSSSSSSVRSTTPSSRRTSASRGGRFRLEIRQHPTDGLAFGDETNVSRNARAVPLDPPIVCELVPETPEDRHLLSLPELSLRARLTDVDGEVISETPNGQSPLVGDCSQSAFVAQVFPPSEQSYFIFSEVAVRLAGSYRLRFDVLDRTGLSFHHLGSIFTDVFTVSGKREFPGQAYSSELIQAIARRGLKIKTKVPKSLHNHHESDKLSAMGPLLHSGPFGRQLERSPNATHGSPGHVNFRHFDGSLETDKAASTHYRTSHFTPTTMNPSEGRLRPPSPRSSTYDGHSHPSYSHEHSQIALVRPDSQECQDTAFYPTPNSLQVRSGPASPLHSRRSQTHLQPASFSLQRHSGRSLNEFDASQSRSGPPSPGFHLSSTPGMRPPPTPSSTNSSRHQEQRHHPYPYSPHTSRKQQHEPPRRRSTTDFAPLHPLHLAPPTTFQSTATRPRPPSAHSTLSHSPLPIQSPTHHPTHSPSGVVPDSPSDQRLPSIHTLLNDIDMAERQKTHSSDPTGYFHSTHRGTHASPEQRSRDEEFQRMRAGFGGHGGPYTR